MVIRFDSPRSASQIIEISEDELQSFVVAGNWYEKITGLPLPKPDFSLSPIRWFKKR